jgi:ABC-2 type transport system ATP-binding protein
MISVSKLTKDYGSRRAIDNLTFNADKGEILGFLGPNGAGKTTTMRILTTYLPPTSGKVTIGGFDILSQSLEVRKLVGYLPETVPLYPDMTVFDYLKFMANIRKVEDVENRVDEILEMVHLEDRADGYISNLSKGMRQRVGLAQALIHKPEVLILDEPTIGLDPVQIIEVRNIIREIGREKTILLSTHILSEAQQVCNRVLIINKGHIVAEDTPAHLQTRLTGAHRVTLRVQGNPEDVVSLIRAIPEVISVTIQSDESIIYESAPNQDARASIARTIIEHGFDLIELHSEGLSLEDIFLQLTRDEPESPVLAETEEVDDEEEDLEDEEIEEEEEEL